MDEESRTQLATAIQALLKSAEQSLDLAEATAKRANWYLRAMDAGTRFTVEENEEIRGEFHRVLQVVAQGRDALHTWRQLIVSANASLPPRAM